MSMTIQDQINLLEEQKSTYLSESPVNTNKVDAIAKRIEELKNEQSQQEEREKEVEDKIESEGITFNVPGVNFKELPAELITLIDNVVRADRRRIYAEENERYDKQSAEHKESDRAAEERELNLKFQNEELQKIIDKGRADNQLLNRENSELKDRVATINAEKEDLEQKLRNAAATIDEQANEIERLNSQVDDYQKAKVFGEREAQKIIDTTPEETDTMQNLVDSIAKKYVAVKPIGGNWHEAVTEDGRKDVLHTKDLPSLETQGSPFRDNQATELSSNQLPSAEAIANVGNQFQTITPPSVPNIGTGSQLVTSESESVRESGEAQVTRAEFEELKGRVDVLFRNQEIVSMNKYSA